MRTALRLGLFLSFVLAHWAAHAQIFMCKDASGRTITSDRPIPECADRAMRELDKSGRARRDIPPPMSAEEKRQAQLQEEKRKADESAADEKRRSDRLLRARYRSEADIETARKRSLEAVDEQIKRERIALATAEKQQQKVQAEVNTHKSKNTPVPAALQHQLDDAVQTISDTKKRIQEDEAEVVQINVKYDETLKRYRELAAEK